MFQLRSTNEVGSFLKLGFGVIIIGVIMLVLYYVLHSESKSESESDSDPTQDAPAPYTAVQPIYRAWDQQPEEQVVPPILTWPQTITGDPGGYYQA